MLGSPTLSLLPSPYAFPPKLALSWVWQGSLLLKNFTPPLGSLWDGYYFIHSFLTVPECPTPLLGRDLLKIVIGENSVLRPPFQILVMQTEDHVNTLIPTWESQVDLAV